jgi:tetratricopeptide (TPR) repeat protein
MKLGRLSIISLGITFLLGLGSLSAQDAGADVWQQIDELNDASDFDGAYTLLEPLAADFGDDVVYLWRMARHHFNESDNTTDEEVIQRELYQGFEFAKQALASDSMNSYANGYYGILIGRVGEIEGTKQKILNSYDVAKYTKRAIELDPNYDSWQHVLGRWHYTLADLSWFERTIASIVYADPPDASFEEAELYFMKAAELAPDDIRHFLWLGKTRLELDKDDSAREALKVAVSLPQASDSDAILQDEAKELLEDLD